jgi:SAM-dependent methyltransferase
MQIQAPAFDQINQKVSPDDDMYIGHGDEHYFGVGEKALANILAALNTTNVDLRVKKILDLPSGYGRVLRWLKASFPEAEITACDTNNKAVDFTAEEFNAIGVYSEYDLTKIKLPFNDYDLIWCGSLLTHFDQSRWIQLLELFHNHLALNGILIFTTHGRLADPLMRQQNPIFGLEPAVMRDIMANYDKMGFGYANYDDKYPVYGISISSPSWVLKQMERFTNLRICYLLEGGWGHQDVYGAVKNSR